MNASTRPKSPEALLFMRLEHYLNVKIIKDRIYPKIQTSGVTFEFHSVRVLSGV